MSTQNIILNSVDDISTVNNELKIRLPAPYLAKYPDRIALNSLSLYYSWFTITAAFNNNACQYVWTDGITYTVTFPFGSYTVDQISQYIQFTMQANGHYLFDPVNGVNVYYMSLAINPCYYNVLLTCTAIPTTLGTLTNPAGVVLNGKCPQLVTGTNNWGKLIGFANSTSFPATLSTVSSQFQSTLVPQISPVTKIYVTCDWVNASRFSKYGNVIASFTPNQPYLSLLSFMPSVPLWYDILETVYSTISIRFMDQNFQPIQLIDTNQIDVALIVSVANPTF
jgi:hypothetical protein